MENKRRPAEDSEDTFSRKDIERMIVKPLTRHAQRLAKKNERLFNGLLFAMEKNFENMEKQVIDRLKEVEASLEVIARELARQPKLETSERQNARSK